MEKVLMQLGASAYSVFFDFLLRFKETCGRFSNYYDAI